MSPVIQRWIRRLRPVLLALPVVAVLAVGVSTALGRPAGPVVPVVASPDGGLHIEVPEVVAVGEGFGIVVRPAPSDVTIDLVTPWAVQRLVAPAGTADAGVWIDGAAVRRSGTLVVTASAADMTGRATVEVEARSAVEPLVPLAGPRSIVADGEHWTMVSLMPSDLFGNPLADDTPALIEVIRADGSRETRRTTVQRMLVGERIYSGTVAGTMTIRAVVDGAIGPQIEVAEVPGPPVPFQLTWELTPATADGRTLAVLRTSVLRDRYGNVLLDGTGVTLRGTGPDGAFVATAPTIDGRAEFHLEAPTRPGEITATASVAGVTATLDPVDAEPTVTQVPVAASRDGEVVEVLIGPVVTGFGGYAPDGTTVSVTIDGELRTIALSGGTARLEAEAVPGTTVVVSVLGARQEVVV